LQIFFAAVFVSIMMNHADKEAFKAILARAPKCAPLLGDEL
jgi:hypothetical protein